MDMDLLSRIVRKALGALPGNDAAFLGRVYSSDLETYVNRLRAIGFINMERVLDAGCGFGQWSLALAGMNARVSAIDAADNRIEFLTKAGETLCPDSIDAFVGRIDDISLPGAVFEGVFCYGVLFLTPWKKSLAEMTRVLKPGGQLYVNANGLGWYKHLWYNAPNIADDYDPTEHAAKVLLNTWKYRKGEPLWAGVDILIEPDEIRAELEALGYGDIRMGGEGTLRTDSAPDLDVKPFFQPEYLGDTGVYEVLATKRNG